MLPFLKHKKVAGLIMSVRKPDGGDEEMHSEGDELHALEAAADDMLRAFESKDSKALAKALKAAHEICESYPHNEADESADESEE